MNLTIINDNVYSVTQEAFTGVKEIDKIQKEHTLLDKYYPYIEENLPRNEKMLIRHIAQYRDRNIAILSDVLPLNYPVFSKKDEDIVLMACGINKEEARRDFVAAKIPSNINRPPDNYAVLPMVLMLIIRYYMRTEQPKKIEPFYYYFAYSKYWLIYHNHFKFKPRPETMQYTIDNLSGKYKLKQFGSIDELLYHSVSSNIMTNQKRLIDSSNAEIYYVNGLIHSSINNFMNGILTEYNKHNEEKKAVFKGSTFTDDGFLREPSSKMGDVEQLSQQYTSQFFASPAKMNLIKLIGKMRSISVQELKNTINYLIDQQLVDDVRDFYSALFYVYFEDEKNTVDLIKSQNFVWIMENIYKKGNSINKNIMKIKHYLDKWLEKGNSTYQMTNSTTTINGFRKAVFNYMTLMVASNE